MTPESWLSISAHYYWFFSITFVLGDLIVDFFPNVYIIEVVLSHIFDQQAWNYF